MTPDTEAFDQAAAVADADLLARVLRTMIDTRLTEIRATLGSIPAGDDDRRRWAAGLTEDHEHLLAEHDDLAALRAAIGQAWAEDRWADVAHTAHRHRRRFELADDLVAVIHRLEDLDRAHPGLGRRADSRIPGWTPPDRAGHRVPWGVDPDAPARGPAAVRRDLWALLRRRFPGASSGACTVAANELLTELLEPAVQLRQANELRTAVSTAITAGTRRPLEQHDQQWTVESILTDVVAGLLAERNLLAGAVTDVAALHQAEGGICPACQLPSPCPTARAVGSLVTGR
ncbi:hypothetical protein [Kitasatospora kifunensis]|uniref:Uncharacterized protein n=1 Tax=Kitasatospora kifunensis TaxID=58351 RepID=A0A7W7RBN8_KITKI|nr:hypothetical protein [Kitasatospora kifunensis]MBB4929032.1 hypothetical protein [Kitasatospora kifunensis]